jgi:uncharacterized delta-60 repeat protein
MFKKNFISVLLTVALGLIPFSIALGAPGDLDTATFNAPYGYFTYGGSNDFSYAVAIQSDGKMVVAGMSYNGINCKVLVMRLNSNGTLDSTFGTGGIVMYDCGNDCYGLALAIQSDGKIVATGGMFNGANYEVMVIRLNIDGSLDNTFGTGGVVTYDSGKDDDSYAVALQSDGKIVIVGDHFNGTNYDVLVMRLNNNGTLDNTFGTGGVVIYDSGGDDFGNAVTIQSDGKIVVTGDRYNGIKDYVLVLRLNSSGILDNTFGTGGIFTYNSENNSYGWAVAIQSDAKMVVTGIRDNVTNCDILVLRLNSNGILDNTFGTGGVVTYNSGNDNYAFAMAIQSDSKIVVTGFRYNGANYDVLVMRLDSSGTLDNTFGSGGIVTYNSGNDSYSFGVAIQTDGKIVVEGGNKNGINDEVLVLRLIGDDPPAPQLVTISASMQISPSSKSTALPAGSIAGNSGTIAPPTVKYDLVVTYNVKNKEKKNSKASTLKFYLSKDPYLSADDIYVGDETIPSIGSDKALSKSKAFQVTISNSNTWYIIGVLDNKTKSSLVTLQSSTAPSPKR